MSKEKKSGENINLDTYEDVQKALVELQTMVIDARDDIKNRGDQPGCKDRVKKKVKEAHVVAQVLVKYFQSNTDNSDNEFKKLTTDFYMIMEEFQAVHKMSSELKLRAAEKKKKNDEDDDTPKEEIQIDIPIDEIEFKSVDLSKAKDDAEDAKKIVQNMASLQEIVEKNYNAVKEDTHKVEIIESKVEKTKASAERARAIIEQAEAQQRAARMKHSMLAGAAALVVIIIVIIIILQVKN